MTYWTTGGRARIVRPVTSATKTRDMTTTIQSAGRHTATTHNEFATYHARQPKHWRDSEADDCLRYEAQLCWPDQIAGTRCVVCRCWKSEPPVAIAISTPARSADGQELAAYDCASCITTSGSRHQRTPLESSAIRTLCGKPAVAIASMWKTIGHAVDLQRRIETGVAGGPRPSVAAGDRPRAIHIGL